MTLTTTAARVLRHLSHDLWRVATALEKAPAHHRAFVTPRPQAGPVSATPSWEQASPLSSASPSKPYEATPAVEKKKPPRKSSPQPQKKNKQAQDTDAKIRYASLEERQQHFLHRVTEVWGEGRWEINPQLYVNYYLPITVKCVTHGEVCTTAPANLLHGGNPCWQCQIERRKAHQPQPPPRRHPDREAFIARVKECVGEKVDLDSIVYSGMSHKCEVTCTRCGTTSHLWPQSFLNAKEFCPTCRAQR